MRGWHPLVARLLLVSALSLAGCTTQENNCTDSVCGNDNDRSHVNDRPASQTPAKKSAAEKIKSLDLGLDIDLFERTLGRDTRISTYAGDSDDFAIYKAEGGVARQLTVRIYKVEGFYIQVGANRTGTVIVMIVQACDPANKLTMSRQGRPVTLNETRFEEMSPEPPKRASYNIPASNPAEFLEFSSPAEVDDGVGEVWGSGPACNSGWSGKAEEPLINWNGTENGAAPSLFAATDSKAVDPWQELKRFRHGKILNLYGKAAPVYVPADFPLLPGHGTPEEIISRLENQSRDSDVEGALT
ncbi:hypothetical protein [Streptomyces flaveus]|uniref:hypothetical protein n=1 Tax=Streptomyces flaveus TaxID=66370 RepID=UPI003329C304